MEFFDFVIFVIVVNYFDLFRNLILKGNYADIFKTFYVDYIPFLINRVNLFQRSQLLNFTFLLN